MGVGDTIEIAVPSDLGYGPQGGGPIPGGATLLFKIELRGIVGQYVDERHARGPAARKVPMVALAMAPRRTLSGAATSASSRI